MTRGNTIGRVARQAGVGVETVRFYERRGLIKRPATPTRGFREYPDDVVDRVRFIRHAKDLGFTLTEVRDLLSLRTTPRSSCEAVKRRAERKVADVEAKIASLRRIRRELRNLARACDERAPSADCPILEALE